MLIVFQLLKAHGNIKIWVPIIWVILYVGINNNKTIIWRIYIKSQLSMCRHPCIKYVNIKSSVIGTVYWTVFTRFVRWLLVGDWDAICAFKDGNRLLIFIFIWDIVLIVLLVIEFL